jgi:predicted component of type VI protein secretion system
MSLRVAASKQALIKVRAAEAGLPASAYLRQCALQVEQLRVHPCRYRAKFQVGPFLDWREL